MIFLAALPLLLALQNTGPGCSISGKVINAATGEPVKGAQVNGVGTTPLITDAAGQFSTTGLTAGLIYVGASSPRFPGLFGMAQATTQVVLKPGESRSDVVLKLIPGALIAGRILDDAGEPISGCNLTLSTAEPGGQIYGGMGGAGSTNDKGEYRLSNVSPNLYHLFARCDIAFPVSHALQKLEPAGFDPQESWAPIYYPNSSSKSGATVLTALPGGQLDGIDFQMHSTRVATLHGKVALPADTPQDAFLQARLLQLSDPDASPLPLGIDRQVGTFVCQFLRPGAYRLDVWAMANGRAGSLAVGGADISIGNTPPEPVIIQLGSTTVIKGSLDAPVDQQQSGQPHVALRPVGNANAFFASTDVEVSGNTFDLPGVLPGKWQVTVQTGPNPSYVESIEWAGRRVASAEIDVLPGDAGPLRIRLNNQFGKLRGSVIGGFQGAVYAIPTDRPRDDVAMSPVAFAQNGIFTSDRVRPGDYKVFAFGEGGLPVHEQLMKLLAKRGASVTVAEGAEQSVEAPVLSSDDLYQTVLDYLRTR